MVEEKNVKAKCETCGNMGLVFSDGDTFENRNNALVFEGFFPLAEDGAIICAGDFQDLTCGSYDVTRLILDG